MARYTDASCRLCRRKEKNFSLKVKGVTQTNVLFPGELMLPANKAAKEKNIRVWYSAS